ncbi:MAG TPA: RluA family pseudouridine synthase [Candidatus Saccharimonadales bacterium]|jgi:23S rRNA pseudouridine1911/1915/1917 synthase
MRLDQYVALYWPERSRSAWQRAIELGHVTVNGIIETSTKRLLDEDDEVAVNVPAAPDFDGQTLPIIYEDEHVTVINKPTGILSHAKGAQNDEFSVAEFMRTRQHDGDDTDRPGIVHRLDRGTSGIIICSRDASTKKLLQKQFQDRKAHKAYLAVVKGVPKDSEARLELPIARNPKKPATFRVDPAGKSAATRYQVLSSNGRFAVVKLWPETGRTHQLRVHMSYVGTPIVGDVVYGSGEGPINRLCLHAESIEITIPPSRRQTFEAPAPDDLQQFMDSIRD